MEETKLEEVIQEEFEKLYQYLDIKFEEVHANIDRLEVRIEEMAANRQKNKAAYCNE